MRRELNNTDIEGGSLVFSYTDRIIGIYLDFDLYNTLLEDSGALKIDVIQDALIGLDWRIKLFHLFLVCRV